MEGGALLSPEFKKFSENHVMFLHITTRIKDRKHDRLLGEVGGTGFPSFFILESDGSVVGKHPADLTDQSLCPHVV